MLLVFVAFVVCWCVLLWFSVVRSCCLLCVMYSCSVFASCCRVLLRCFSLVRVDVVRRCLMFVVGVLRVNRCSCCGVLWLSVEGICCLLMLFWFVVCCSSFAVAACCRFGALVRT